MSYKVVLKKMALILMAYLGYGTVWWWLRCFRNPSGARILRYHSISNSRRHEVNVKVGNFQRQMEFLKKRYNPVPLEFLKNDGVAVTLDDGYMDNYQNAYPVLKKLNIPATVFLTSDYIGTDKLLPHDRRDNPNANRLLNWDQIREMDNAQIRFGSHSATHVNLAKIQSEKAEEEITGSKRKIEQTLGHKIDFFSYPYGTNGDFDNELKQMVKEAGYKCACTAMYGVNYSDTDIYELRRIGIEASDTIFTFKAKLNGALDILKVFETKLGRKIIKVFNKLAMVES